MNAGRREHVSEWRTPFKNAYRTPLLTSKKKYTLPEKLINRTELEHRSSDFVPVNFVRKCLKNIKEKGIN